MELIQDGERVFLGPENITTEKDALATVLHDSYSKNPQVFLTNEISEDYNEQKGWFTFKTELNWTNIISISILHLIFVYSMLLYSYRMYLSTFLFGVAIGQAGGFGVTGGVHRLWCHRSYKAKWPLRVILMICYSIAGQNTIHEWVRDHRVHHKHTETDADPHDSRRGFFFAHVGWLMMKKHPEVIRCGHKIDMSDVLNDPIVAFNQKYFLPMKLLLCFIIPVVVPVYCWGESWYTCIMAQIFFRYVCGLNFTWSVNSAAHIWGNKPYDKNMGPAENLAVSFLALGEGWHNYHHVFPWDYKAAELGNYSFNTTTMLIDMFAKIGWAYDLKQPSMELVRKTVLNHGDGTHHEWRSVAEPKEE